MSVGFTHMHLVHSMWLCDRAGLPLELLYADDLILIAESEESLHETRVGSKRFQNEYRNNEGMFSCSMKDKVEEKGKWSCGVCKKGVGSNSILCHSCKKWIRKQKQCSERSEWSERKSA